MHSWSKKGTWTPCCYTSDHANAGCSWSKPGELTPYKADGFEVVYFDYQIPVPGNVLEKWKKNPTNNDMLLNMGQWSTESWKAIGVGIYGNYASVWLGKLPDKEGAPKTETKENHRVWICKPTHSIGAVSIGILRCIFTLWNSVQNSVELCETVLSIFHTPHKISPTPRTVVLDQL